MSSRRSNVDMDRLPCGVVEICKDRRILYCNQYASKLLGVPSDSLESKPLKSIISAASSIFLDSYVYPLLLDSSVAEELQLVFRSSDGTRISVVVSIAMEEDGSSLWSFMSCENRDKLLEELLSTRDRLGEKAHQLTSLNEQIKGENEDLQLLCRSLSHDLRAPILRAQQMVALVAGGLCAKNLQIDEELEMLDMVERNLNVLKMLINGLLEFLIADANVQHNETVDLNEIINEAISLNDGLSEVSIVVSKGTLPTIMGNSAQLLVLFKNLIDNATKYSEKLPEIEITCDSNKQKTHYVIAIKDNGIGISSEYHTKIFEPFLRVHREGGYIGSGLGLSIVKKLVAKNNGEISTKSSLGKGSTFFVTFPVPAQKNMY